MLHREEVRMICPHWQVGVGVGRVGVVGRRAPKETNHHSLFRFQVWHSSLGKAQGVGRGLQVSGHMLIQWQGMVE